MTTRRDDFEKWWDKQTAYHYPKFDENMESSLKELAWNAFNAGIRSLEPDGIGCETW